MPRIPDDLDLAPAETVALAQQLLDRGFAFNAHEVLEGAWKQRGDAERALWQGLAQLAVGVTHAQRGNTAGAAKLLRRACGRLADYDGDQHGIDVAGLVDYAFALADDLDRGAALSADRLRPQLTR